MNSLIILTFWFIVLAHVCLGLRTILNLQIIVYLQGIFTCLANILILFQLIANLFFFVRTRGILIKIIIIVAFIVFLRGLDKFDFVNIRDWIGVPLCGGAWLVPIIGYLYGTQIICWKILFDLILKSTFLGIIVFIGTLIMGGALSDLYLTDGAPYLLLFLDNYNLRNNIIIMIGSFAGLFRSLFHLRRNEVLSKIFFICFSLWVFSKKKLKWRLINRFVIFFVLILSFFSIIAIYQSEQIDWLPKSIDNQIQKFKAKTFQNSRENLYLDFFKDMSSYDLLIGRGAMGEYFGYVGSSDERGIMRRNVECGYLQIVLKSGLIFLVPVFILGTINIRLSMLHSNNFFAKFIGIVILGWFIDMLPYGMPELNIRYLIFWMAMGAASSDTIRNLSDIDIQDKLFK